MSHLDAGEERDVTEIETETDFEVVSAQGTEVGLKGMITEASEEADVAGDEGTGGGSHVGSDEQVKLESENEAETESEGYAEGEKEDVCVHEQVAVLAAVEAIGEGFLEGSEEEIEEKSVDLTETNEDDAERQNVTYKEFG